MINLFTKVISGPIVRGNDFLPQIDAYKGISFNGILSGMQIFFFGLFKKIVLAAISYSLQIHFDFAGYSDMAIGASQILGFNIRPNFNLPYVSKNPSEFWERWHISLSSWLRDYLYFPLGGNRKGKIRTYFNLLTVMIISGLWHGAGWTFIAWGFIHGIYSCIYKYIDTTSGKRLSHPKYMIASGFLSIINFVIITVLWIFFRADNFANALSVITNCFTIHTGINQPYAWTFFAIGILFLSMLIATIRSKKQGETHITGFYPCLDLSKIYNQVLFFTFIGITIVIGYFGNTAFIYGAFLS